MIRDDSGISNTVERVRHPSVGPIRSAPLASRRVRWIRPTRPWHDLGLAELFAARELVGAFARRALTLRYRQTLLGVGWVVLQPLLSSGVLALVFGHFAGLSEARGAPYMLNVYAALLPWLLFAQSAQRAALVLATERTLLLKTAMPRMALPLASVLALGVDLLVALGFFVGIAACVGHAPHAQALWLPALCLPLFAFSFGAALLLSVLNVYFRDVRNAVPFALQVGFFLTPIAYGAERVGDGFRWLLWLNPLAGHVQAFRWALLAEPSTAFPSALFGVSAIASLGTLGLGVLVFRRVERELADVI